MKAELGSSPGRSEGGRRKNLRLTLLFLTAAALFLVSAAQALAAPVTAKVNMTGTGSGEVISNGTVGESGSGTPPIACFYDGTIATGTCENVVHVGSEEEPFGFAVVKR